MPKTVLSLVATTMLLLAACGGESAAQKSQSPGTNKSLAASSSRAMAPPILAEPRAVEIASRKAERGSRGLTGVTKFRNPQARLMTMGEYWASGRYDDGFFGSAEWYPESDLPVWVVLMDGNSESILSASSPLTPALYDYFVVVLNAHTGYEIGASPLSAPDQLLADAQGLDPALYARYPLEAALEYTKEVTDFPVSEPSFLPGGYSLARVTLELAHPLQDLLPNPWEPRRTVLQSYSDGQGSTIQLAQFDGELPDLVQDADLATVQDARAWASDESGESTWLAWTWVYPEAGAYVTNILYSVARSVSLDTLHEIAESMPGGRPPLPTPEPLSVPTALTAPTPTPAPMPTLERTILEEPPLGPGAKIGEGYPYTLYVHCGIRDARFDGRRWMADPMLSDGSGNPPEDWTRDDSVGVIELVNEDLARFRGKSGKVIEFRPWPSDMPWIPCA